MTILDMILSALAGVGIGWILLSMLGFVLSKFNNKLNEQAREDLLSRHNSEMHTFEKDFNRKLKSLEHFVDNSFLDEEDNKELQNVVHFTTHIQNIGSMPDIDPPDTSRTLHNLIVMMCQEKNLSQEIEDTHKANKAVLSSFKVLFEDFERLQDELGEQINKGDMQNFSGFNNSISTMFISHHHALHLQYESCLVQIRNNHHTLINLFWVYTHLASALQLSYGDAIDSDDETYKQMMN